MTAHNHFSFFIYSTLFFGYLVYSFAVLRGFPDFLGGMFSLSVLAFFPVVFLKYIDNLKKESNAIEWLYFLLLCYVLSYSIIAALFFNTSLSDPPVLKGLLFICYSLVGWYVGRFLTLENYIFRNLNYLFIIYISVFFLTTIIAQGNIFALLFILLDESGTAATYQGIGRSIFFMGIFTLLFSKKNRIALFIFFILLLFLVGSRTHILGFVLLFFIYLLLIYPKSSLIAFSLLLALLAVLLSIINIYFPETYDAILKSRLTELFNLASSDSFNVRLRTYNVGWGVISNYPFFGSFGHYFYNGGGYPHNILYAWSNWGFLSFILILGIFFSTFIQTLISALNKKSHKLFFLISYIVTVIVLYIFLLAPIDDVSLGILIGLYVGIINEKQKNYSYL